MMGKELKSLRILEWNAKELRGRLRVCETVIAERRTAESSLMNRLRTASTRVRANKETRVLVHGKQVRVRKEGWRENKKAFHETLQREAERVEVFVSMLEILLDIKAPPKKGMVGGRVRRKENDPVINEAKDEILSFLEANEGGHRKADIVEALGMDSDHFKHAIKALGGEGKIKKSGSRRAMTYEKK